MLVQQTAGTESDFVCIENPATMLFDRINLTYNITRDILGMRTVFTTFDVHTGPDQLQGINCRQRVIDGNEINTGKGGKTFCP